MEINKAMTDIKTTNFNVEDEVTISDYLSVNIQGFPYGKIKLSHPIFIVWIISDTQPTQSNPTMVIPAV